MIRGLFGEEFSLNLSCEIVGTNGRVSPMNPIIISSMSIIRNNVVFIMMSFFVLFALLCVVFVFMVIL